MSAERWVYLGERVGQNIARVAVWRDESGHRLAYRSKPNMRGTVGYVYTFDVERDDDGKAASVLFPGDWTGDKAPDCDELKLEADAARRELNQARDQRAAAKNLTMTGLLDRAVTAATGMTYTAREEMIDQLAQAIRRAR